MEKWLSKAEVVLSHFQATRLLEHKREPGAVTASPDLGRSLAEAQIRPEGVTFPNGITVTWQDLEAIQADPNGCFVVDGEGLWRIQAYSEATQRAYSLLPTERAPTLLVSGIPMHRIKGTDPNADTLEKIDALGHVHGRILDTATGLGYTAIAAAERGATVMTVELDPVVLEVARENPWSDELFSNPAVSIIVGDSARLVQGFPAGRFDAIVHDPPTFSLAGELYSGALYRDLFRALKEGGRLFHYVGNPDTPSGKGETRSVMQRLRAAGFRNVVPAPAAFGVVARKGLSGRH
jgi:predicted methyltransferase